MVLYSTSSLAILPFAFRYVLLINHKPNIQFDLCTYSTFDYQCDNQENKLLTLYFSFVCHAVSIAINWCVCYVIRVTNTNKIGMT